MSGNNNSFGGFPISKQSLSKMSFGMSAAPRSSGAGHMLNIGRKRVRSEDEYFEEDETAEAPAYQPAPGSPGQKESDDANDSDSDDPLDQFMESIQTEVTNLDKKKKSKPKRDDIENEDVQEAYFK